MEYTERSGKAVRCFHIDESGEKRKAVISCVRKRKNALVILAMDNGEGKPKFNMYTRKYDEGKKLIFENLERADECISSEEIDKMSKDNT